MCAQYLIIKNLKNLEKLSNFKIDLENLEYPIRIMPHVQAPVIAKTGIKLMNFSLIPSWSKERRPKFATHNARIETIAEKATWKKPFLYNHCVVPMSSFVEPIYTGNLAGNMVGFKSQEFLFAAGITDTWIDRATGEEVESFAIITSEPSDFVKTIGHDRQPVFIQRDDIPKWLNMASKDSKTMIDELLEMAIVPPLETGIDRPLKAGWEKRIPQ